MKIRNIIHGMDTVMSHITHFYHLSAADFIDFTGSAVNMSPWLPSYTTADLVDGTSSLGNSLILNYVEALRVRRLCHTAGALYSGRQPIQNAIVPGGVTTPNDATYPLTLTAPTEDLFGPFNAVTTKEKFTALLSTIRNFIDTTYLPDVLTVATSSNPNYLGFWSAGKGCQKVLAYGDFPMDDTGTLLLKRGVATSGYAAGTLTAFDQQYIKEYVDYSYFDYGFGDTGLHPFEGQTAPNMGSGGYSWIKAPRYNGTVCEVGPLARIWTSYLSSDTSLTVTNTAAINFTAGSTLTINAGAYSVRTLVTAVHNWLNNVLGAGSSPGCLFSALGRHACRMLETKLLADACDYWAGSIGTGSAYTYKAMPKTITKGYGLAEAPRGALGHWIKIEGRKVAKYQCVVPSTWNFSPAHGVTTASSITNRGAVEASLVNTYIGPESDPQQQIVNILRVVHPFDCCIACAVHVVSPDGKEKLSFAIDPDGRPSKIHIADK